MALIEDFSRGLGNRRFEYGVCDCLLVVSDWVLVSTGIDPAARFRHTYSTEEGYVRLLKKHGGPVALFDKLASDIGWYRTDRPVTGDVGLLGLKDDRIVGAIRNDAMWVVKLNDSVQMLRVDQFVAAWSPECRSS